MRMIRTRIGSIHSGFYCGIGRKYKRHGLVAEEDESDPITPELHGLIAKIVALRQVDNGQRKLFITGHSLGAALAAVFGGFCHVTKGLEGALVYTFGQPRTGEQESSSPLSNL